MSKQVEEMDLNGEIEDCKTGRIEACIAGSEEMVHFLLNAGCPAQPPEGFKHTPLRGATV